MTLLILVQLSIRVRLSRRNSWEAWKVVSARVVNVMLAPFVVPRLLVATSRKWYVVFGVRGTRCATISTPLVPLPADCTAVVLP
jgi:hypothetical protein